ncbi:MAG: cytochrome c peroxidase [Bdellovibrionota bacterium]
MRTHAILLSMAVFLCACGWFGEKNNIDYQAKYPSFYATFGDQLDLGNLPNYAHSSFPAYIAKDNTRENPITDEGALLGRILFYDKNLSSNKSISCSSCHQQGRAFSDSANVSDGVNGQTNRHSMRLINSRFSNEVNFFWDERVSSLEEQTTKPIQDHNEMGFSGTMGDPGLQDLVERLSGIGYYADLFDFAFGNQEITEEKIQQALAQFVRSIQSFDSKYDEGRANASNDRQHFFNFTADENAGKALFLNRRADGGAGCGGCHRPPEFDIDPNSLNNGIVGVFDSAIEEDLTVTRSPSLRDLVDASGNLHGPLMHDASITSLEALIDHYDSGIENNAGLDNRLKAGGNPQRLNLTDVEKNQLIEFLKSLSGSDVYSNSKWSDPFP